VEKGCTCSSSPKDTQAVISTSHFCPDFQILNNCFLTVDQKHTGFLKLFKNMLAPALRSVLCILLQQFCHCRCMLVSRSFVLAVFPLKHHSSLLGKKETILRQADSGLNSSGCCSPVLSLPGFQALTQWCPADQCGYCQRQPCHHLTPPYLRLLIHTPELLGAVMFFSMKGHKTSQPTYIFPYLEHFQALKVFSDKIKC